MKVISYQLKSFKTITQFHLPSRTVDIQNVIRITNTGKNQKLISIFQGSGIETYKFKLTSLKIIKDNPFCLI